MDAFEIHTHSFIVKTWRERLRDGTDQFTWRGHITHVPSGARRYLDDLNDICLFILPYLESMGVQEQPDERGPRRSSRWRACAGRHK